MSVISASGSTVSYVLILKLCLRQPSQVRMPRGSIGRCIRQAIRQTIRRIVGGIVAAPSEHSHRCDRRTGPRAFRVELRRQHVDGHGRREAGVVVADVRGAIGPVVPKRRGCPLPPSQHRIGLVATANAVEQVRPVSGHRHFEDSTSRKGHRPDGVRYRERMIRTEGHEQCEQALGGPDQALVAGESAEPEHRRGADRCGRGRGVVQQVHGADEYRFRVGSCAPERARVVVHEELEHARRRFPLRVRATRPRPVSSPSRVKQSTTQA